MIPKPLQFLLLAPLAFGPMAPRFVAIAERLQGRNKRPEKHGNISTLTDQGATRDIAASKAGLGSGKTLEAAQKVIERGITVVLPVITKPTSITVATGCKSCRHRRRPGLSAGYCGGGRDDLPGAYGLHHPLGKLPDDQGVACTSYRPHEG